MESTIDFRTKSILAKIYASQFVEDMNPMDYLVQRLSTDEALLESDLAVLRKRNLIMISDHSPHLTREGRMSVVAVFTGGAFDILHPGHIETLEQARALGDVLIVSVARDATYERNKNRKPHHNELLRQKL
ncbi:MAG: adenylyltransferase/cytidyltransferase family protein, partial [Thaumarchaeota archaeon]|nr:adenylyltransferase/cytidyltransferase family protein [Nitrososphaerota archaeon]